jgi:hypothetical protein
MSKLKQFNFHYEDHPGASEYIRQSVGRNRSRQRHELQKAGEKLKGAILAVPLVALRK